jgi:outer membrane protein assembly factor BamB
MIRKMQWFFLIIIGIGLLFSPSIIFAQGGLQDSWPQFQMNKDHTAFYSGGSVLPAKDPLQNIRVVWQSDGGAPGGTRPSIPVVNANGFVYQLIDGSATTEASIRRLATTLDNNGCKVIDEINQITAILPVTDSEFDNISPVIDTINGNVYIVSNTGDVFAYDSLLSVNVWPTISLGGTVVCSPTFDPSSSRLYVVQNLDVDLDGEDEGQLVVINTLSGQVIYTWSAINPLSLTDPNYRTYFAAPVGVANVSDGINLPVDHVYVLSIGDNDEDGTNDVLLHSVEENVNNPGFGIEDWVARLEPVAAFNQNNYQYSALTVLPNLIQPTGEVYADILVCSRSGTVYGFEDQVSLVDNSLYTSNPLGVAITGSPAFDGRNLYVLTQSSMVILDTTLATVATYNVSGGTSRTSPVIDSNSIVYFSNNTTVYAITYMSVTGNFVNWNIDLSGFIAGTMGTPAIGYVVNDRDDNPVYGLYITENDSNTLTVLEQNAKPNGTTLGVANTQGYSRGYRLLNNMGLPATTFTYQARVTSNTNAGQDSDCDEVPDAQIQIDSSLPNLNGIFCTYSDMQNGANQSITFTGDMSPNASTGNFEFRTDSTTQLRGGQHEYSVTFTDAWGATFTTDPAALGPNMCPELDDLVPYSGATLYNGMEVKAEYEGDFTNLLVRIKYFDADLELPSQKDIFVVGDQNQMTYDKSSNYHQDYCDWYKYESVVPNTDPFFYFQFKDNTTERGTLSCTTRYPSVGVFYPLKLSEATVSPSVGDPSEVFRFRVKFFSPFNIAPDEAFLFMNNDTIGRPMTFVPGTGSPGNGFYEYVTTPGELSQGLNSYYFFFSNNRDQDPNDINEFSARIPMGNNTFTGPAISSWPLFRHDRMHSGKSNNPSSVVPAVPNFESYRTGGPISGSAIVDWDGRIYFGSQDQKFYCLNSDLSLAWSFQADNWITSSATLGPNGTVIFPSRDNNIYCLQLDTSGNQGGETEQNSDSKLLWKYSAEGISSSAPVVAPNGNIIVGSSDGLLYAIREDGTLNWYYDIGKASIDGSPVVSTNGTIFFGATDTYLYALNSNGSFKWKFKTNDLIRSTPLLIENAGVVQSIVFTSNDTYVYSINNNGTINNPPTMNWRYKTGVKFEASSPAIGGSGDIYVVSDKVYSLDQSNGSLNWSYSDIGNVVFSSPVVDFNEHIIFGCEDNKLYMLNSDGTKAWSYQKDDGPWSSSPIILNNGEIVLGSWGGNLYKISERTANSAPILSNEKITPATGNRATTFVYSIKYNDADKDPPVNCYLNIDNLPPVSMKFKSGQLYNGTYYYEATNLTGGSHTYYFEFSDGDWAGALTTRYPVSPNVFTGPIVNDLPSVTCDVQDVFCVSPDRGDKSTTFIFSAKYNDPDGGVNPGPTGQVYIDGDTTHPYSLILSSGTVHDGVYSYQTTGQNLGSGNHEFYFTFSDYDANVIRFPITGSITGPLVNEKPQLSEGSVTPTNGNTNTEFVYSVHYYDPDNNLVKTALVFIDGLPNPMISKSSTTSGSFYNFTTRLSKGKHNYYFSFTDTFDSVGRFPNNSPDVLQGPFVLQAPELFNATIDPEIGNESTEFVFTVDYRDASGFQPKVSNIMVNNVPYNMKLISGENYDGTYQAIVKGYEIGVGFDNCYYFLFQNTIDAVTRYPSTGCFNGPVILEAAFDIPFWQVKHEEIDTLITLNNIGTLPASVTLTLFTNDGEQIPNPPGSFTIPPRGQRTISLNLDTDIIDNHGYGHVTWSSGSLVAWGLVFNRVTGGSFPVHFDLPKQSPIYSPYYNVDLIKDIDTAIFLTNMSNVEAKGKITIYSQYNQIFAEQPFTIQPGVMQNFLVGRDTMTPSGVEGFAKVEWDQGVLNIFEAVLNTKTGNGYTVHCEPPYTSKIEIPHWRKIKGSGTMMVAPDESFGLQKGNGNIYDYLCQIDSTKSSDYSMPFISDDQIIDNEIINPYNVEKSEEAENTNSESVEKAQLPGSLPVLTEGGVSPTEGSQSKQFLFHIHYYDADGNVPVTSKLVLDDKTYNMDYSSGLAADGVYTSTQYDLSVGTHKFHFEFSDGVDGSVRYPTMGSFVGPMVSDPVAYEWDTNFYLTNLGQNDIPFIIMNLANADGKDNPPITRLSLHSFNMWKVQLGTNSDVINGIGSGSITWDGSNPLLAFGRVFNESSGASYTLEFGEQRNETIYIPAWLTYLSQGITSIVFLSNKSSTFEVTPTLTLFNASGQLVHTEMLAPIAPNATGIVDFSQYFNQGLQFGSGYITWDSGELDVYGNIVNLVTDQYYLMNFDKPRVH